MRKIFCMNCNQDKQCHMVKGSKTYPHRKDLHNLNFWKCADCGGFVGTHNKGLSKTPLGIIASKEMKQLRIKIHSILDPIWKNKKMSRGEIYKKISNHIGYEYHTAELKNYDDAYKIYNFLLEFK